MICDHCDRLVTSCKKSARHSRNFLRFVCLFICLPCLSHSSDLEKKTSQKIQSQVTRSTGIAYSTYCKVPREVESQLYSGNWFRRFSFSFLWEPVGSFCDAPEPPAWKQFVIPQRKRWQCLCSCRAMERKALIWSLLVDTRKGAPQRLPTFTEAPQMVSSLAQMTSVIKYGKFHDTVNF